MTAQTEDRYEKYILTPRELHLGHLKETFKQGAVIALDSVTGKLVVDGRSFDDTRDLDVLKRQAIKKPSNPWIVPFSQEILEYYTGVDEPLPRPVGQKSIDHMTIIQSDEDLIDTIDISHTKIAKRNEAQKVANRQAKKTDKLEIIRGDESVDDRIARLDKENKGDMKSIAERVALKQKKKPKMEIVHDDSLGSMGGSSAAALNAGQPIAPRELIEAKTEEARLLADSRKESLERARKKAAEVDGVDLEALNAEMTPYPVTTPEMKSKDEQIAELEAKLAALQSPASTTGQQRVPVTDEQTAKDITGE